jgi:hypothetical protein
VLEMIATLVAYLFEPRHHPPRSAVRVSSALIYYRQQWHETGTKSLPPNRLLKL